MVDDNDDNPQYGQRGANASYWEMVRKERQKARDADLPPESEETRQYRQYTEFSRQAKTLSFPPKTTFRNIPAKREILRKVMGYDVSKWSDAQVGKVFSKTWDEAQSFLNPEAEEF